MLIITIIFVMVSVVIIFGLATPIIKQIFASRDIWGAKQSYYVSEAGVEDVVYRLKNATFASNIGSQENLSFNGYNATTTITNTSGGKKIDTLSDANDYQKTIETTLIQNIGVSFNYGIFSGNGGFTITGGSNIYGNVYSNGNILGDSGVRITGSAVAASGTSIIQDETNNTPTIPSSSITFNNNYASRDLALSFQPSTTSAVQKISLYIKKTNSPADFTVTLMSDSGGSPGTLLTTSFLYSSQVTTNYSWVDLVFPQNVILNKDTTYWIVITGNVASGRTSTNTYTIAANNSYTRGQTEKGTPGAWNLTNLSGYFSLFVSSSPSKIYGYGGDYLYIGSTSTDQAWASSIIGVSTPGQIYCQVGMNNNGQNCDKSKNTPPAMQMPVSQANIDQWKAEALAGGTYNGDYLSNWSGSILGPRKINGNLTVTSGPLMVTGTIWVTGNIIVNSGGTVKLAPSLGANSAVLVADGYISIYGGGQFQGSGVANSYPIVVSTSACPNATPCGPNNSAISLSGGAGAVVLTAIYGKVNIIGGSGARSVTGDSIYISGGGTITYDTGLVSPSFSSGPAGSWNISSWKELEN